VTTDKHFYECSTLPEAITAAAEWAEREKKVFVVFEYGESQDDVAYGVATNTEFESVRILMNQVPSWMVKYPHALRRFTIHAHDD
jgi:hypothetical protein